MASLGCACARCVLAAAYSFDFGSHQMVIEAMTLSTHTWSAPYSSNNVALFVDTGVLGLHQQQPQIPKQLADARLPLIFSPEAHDDRPRRDYFGDVGQRGWNFGKHCDRDDEPFNAEFLVEKLSPGSRDTGWAFSAKRNRPAATTL